MLVNPYRFGNGNYQHSLISMSFEGADLSQVFTDVGDGGSVWTPSDSNVHLTTTSPLSGSSSLIINSSSSYLETPAVPGSNMLPATGNWKMSFNAKWSNAAGHAFITIGDATLSPAGSQLYVYISQSLGSGNAANPLYVYVSNGTTMPLFQLTTFTQGISRFIEIERIGDTIVGRADGIQWGSMSFTGSINQPTGRKLRIGKSEVTGEIGPNPLVFDNFLLQTP